MSDLIPNDQMECSQAIDLVMNASGVLMLVMSILMLFLGVLIGDAYQVYKWRKQQSREYYCPCCDYPVNEENKGR